MSDALIIGASGLVGGHLWHTLRRQGAVVVGTGYPGTADFPELDIRDRQAVELLLRQVAPKVVYLPAALTNVDYCEQHPQETYAINVLGACHVIQTANQVGAKVVYFSSDYVFAGDDGPYVETDPPRPLSEYGRQKLIVEHYLAFHAPRSLVIRTTVVYGWENQGKNFIYRLLQTLRAGQFLRVPVDQIGNPTYAPNLAEAVIVLTQQDAQGLYHVAGPSWVNRYDFARAAAEVFNLDASLIQPVTTKELQQPAPRPLQAGMRIDKAQACLPFPMLDCWSGLRRMMQDRWPPD
jgi:dTDP-4-dehydrorhamnose reductase